MRLWQRKLVRNETRGVHTALPMAAPRICEAVNVLIKGSIMLIMYHRKNKKSNGYDLLSLAVAGKSFDDHIFEKILIQTDVPFSEELLIEEVGKVPVAEF